MINACCFISALAALAADPALSGGEEGASLCGQAVSPRSTDEPLPTRIGGFSVRLRQSPKLTAKILSVLDWPTGVFILDVARPGDSCWFKIRSGKLTGWMHSDYVALRWTEDGEYATWSRESDRDGVSAQFTIVHPFMQNLSP